MDKLIVRGTEINVQWDLKRDDFLSLTDIAKIKDSDNPRYIIQNWLRNRNTIEFLGVWETLYNPDFNRVEFDAFRSQAGLNSFVMTPQKWVDATGAIGIVSKAGRYANVSQLVCLSNLENLNAVFINEGIPQAERLAKLNAIAISQMKVLTEDHRMLQFDEAKETKS